MILIINQMKVFVVFCLLFSNMVIGQKNVLEYEYTDIYGYTNSSVLIIKGNESVFKVNEDRDSGIAMNNDGKRYVVNTDDLSTFMYSNSNENFVRTLYKKKQILYKYSRNSLPWQITQNTKKIGDYNCMEATLNLHGRNYHAWFTSEIPINQGPLKLHGLPGLIVEVYSEDNFCSLKLLSLKTVAFEGKDFSFCKDFFTDSRDEIMDYDEYQKTITEVMVRHKLKMISIITGGDSSATIAFDEDQNAFTRHVIDIPENAIQDLQKVN